MLKVNIVNELKNTANRTAKRDNLQAESVLNEFHEIMKMESEKDKEMLQYFGKIEIDVKGAEETKKKVEIKLKTGRLAIEDIKSICIKYNLRFLPSTLYKKPVPVHALNDLRNYKEKGGYRDITSYNYNNNRVLDLFIIAPASHFKLGKFEYVKNDPVLLNRIEVGREAHTNNTIYEYELVSQWGNDFTIFRRLSGLYMQAPNLINLGLFYILMYFILSKVLTPIENNEILYLIAWGVVVLGTMFGIAYATKGMVTDANGKSRRVANGVPNIYQIWDYPCKK